jgi:hypothetical protein
MVADVDLVDALSVPICQLFWMVMVLPAVRPVFSITAVSCGKGKLLTLTAPPDVSAHAVSDQFPPAARFQNLLTPASKVMPLLPRQSPKRVPDQGADTPAAAISRKSRSASAATAAAVKVRETPTTSLLTRTRRIAVLAAPNVNVPLTV